MKTRVLVIENSPDVQQELSQILPKQEYTLFLVKENEWILDSVHELNPDLILLATNVPGMDMYKICGLLKQDKTFNSVPIIILGNSDDIEDKIAGLESGADDYLSKPFSGAELVARIKAILRRIQPRAEEEILTAGTINLNLARYEVKVNGTTVKLAPKEFDILYILIKRSGYVVSRDYLIERIWGFTEEVTSRTVDVHIRRLRQKIGSPADRLITTVSGRGYRIESEP